MADQELLGLCSHVTQSLTINLYVSIYNPTVSVTLEHIEQYSWVFYEIISFFGPDAFVF